jgi:hypothetical protein
VKNTDMLGLGFIPNRHKKKKSSHKDQATIRSGTDEAQEEPGRRRLANADSVTRVQVETRTGITQEKEKRKATPDPSVRRGCDPAWWRQHQQLAETTRAQAEGVAERRPKSCGASWETKKRPVRVPLTGCSFIPPRDDPTHGLG